MSTACHWIALLPPPDAEALALGWAALRWTPRVCLLDEAVLMELSTCERLWGGRSALHQQIFEQKHGFRHDGWAFAATSLLALALLRCGKRGGHLPLHTLSAARPHLPMLERAGIRTWSALRALPRDGVARRFGAPLLDALDQALGLRPDVHPWLELPERFEHTLELPALAESAPTLLFGAQRLLQRLRAWLQARQLGVLALQLRWRHDLRRIDGVAVPPWGELPIRTAQPTQDMAHLARLLAEHLARTPLAAPVHTLGLSVFETAPFQPAAPQLLAPQLLDGEGAAPPGSMALHELLERLSARLGAAQVLRLEARADHRPEHRQHWHPAVAVAPAAGSVGAGMSAAPGRPKQAKAPEGLRAAAPGLPAQGRTARRAKASGRGTSSEDMRLGLLPQSGSVPSVGANHQNCDILLPPWLLQAPLPLPTEDERPQHHGPLRLLSGPHRIESGWWPEPAPAPDAPGAPLASPTALRDYFIAHSPQAGLLWIYRQRLPQPGRCAWFLHGVYG